MKCVNSREMAQANKHVLMEALYYNLKKYLKFSRKTPQIITQSVALMKGVHFYLKTNLIRAQFS